MTRTSGIVTRTIKAFFDDNITRLGAALAFYTTIAVAPLMVLAIAAAGILFNETTARERILAEIGNLAGSPALAAIQSVQSPTTSNTGMIATALSALTLVFGAFGVFRQLQDALNSIWRVKAPASK
ncbi:MAG: YhjD/YihY/BrkB family envelope integrity protein, partial [Lacunisphaera sp.]